MPVLELLTVKKKEISDLFSINGYIWIRSCEPPYLSLFSSSWYILSQESGTFWPLLQGRLLLLLTLCRRVKLLLRTCWLFLAPRLVDGFFPITQLVNCFRESISRVVPRRCLSVVLIGWCFPGSVTERVKTSVYNLVCMTKVSFVALLLI